MTERSLMMTDWPAYERRHGVRCIVEEPWSGPVAWDDVEDGSDWFFLIGLGHSGSCVLTELLNLHPDVQCGNEEQSVLALLGLLTTKTVMTVSNPALHWQQGEWSGRDKPFTCETRVVTASYLRHLCEVWRTHYCDGDTLVGDKHTLYRQGREVLRKVFPGCKFIYTLRHPLDQLSGLLNDAWAGNAALRDDPARTWAQVGYYVATFFSVRDEADILTVAYEATGEAGALVRMLRNCFSHLGASPAFGLDVRPFVRNSSIGRWRDDACVCEHLAAWHDLGLMTAAQQDVLTSDAPEYGSRLTAWDGPWTRQA